LSNQITRLNPARPSRKRVKKGCSQARSRCDTKPGWNTRSIAPEPTTWYAMLTPSLVAYKTLGRMLLPPAAAHPILVRRQGRRPTALDLTPAGEQASDAEAFSAIRCYRSTTAERIGKLDALSRAALTSGFRLG
jgi:hypothetical protein